MRFQPHVELEKWQENAREAWLASRHPIRGARHGIADVYTGAGKTFLAMACMVAAGELLPGLKYAVVCPTTPLARQWQRELVKHTTAGESRVGVVGDGSTATFTNHDVLIYVLASARRVKDGASLVARDARGHSVMLVVDECHRTGAQKSSKIYDVASWARLGVSATPQRSSNDACDEDGLPLPIEEQIHGRQLGPVFFAFSLKDGIQNNMLPRFVVHHHGVKLTPPEEDEYATHEETIRDRRKKLESVGGDPDRYQAYISGRRRNTTEQQRAAAVALEQAYFARKMFLYKASERLRVAREILVEAWGNSPPPTGAMLFNERIGADDDSDEEDAEEAGTERERTFGAEALYEQIRADADRKRLPFDASRVVLEHGSLSRGQRAAALDAFLNGRANVLVTVKALQEGIDVPDVGIGVSVASTASARQRIQTMGRILRLPRVKGKRLHPNETAVKHLHLIYVEVEPDMRIYKEKDWSAETGPANNVWWRWDLGGSKVAGEALLPTELTERDAWDDVKNRLPAPWKGPLRAPKYTWRNDTVSKVATGEVVMNPDQVKGILVDRKGRFLVTTLLSVVVKYDKATGESLAYGQLTSALEIAPIEDSSASLEPDTTGESGQPNQEAAGRAARPPRPTYDAVAIEAEELGETFRGVWYELLQFGCQAAARRDAATLRACRAVAAGPATGRRVHVRVAFDILLAGDLDAGQRAEMTSTRRLDARALYDTKQQPELIRIGAEAFVAGESGLLENVERALSMRCDRLPRNKRQKGEALVNAFRLLRGRHLAIVADEVGDQE